MQKQIIISKNKAISKLFYSSKICTTRTNYGLDRFKEGESIIVQRGCRIEPYSTFNAGNVFCSMGSFSYSNSPLKANLEIGRYVSIAPGLTIFGFNHPYDRFTTSPITYWHPFVYQKAIEDLKGNCNYRCVPVVFENKGLLEITIGHDVWIGVGVALKTGINIGHGSIIAAHAVVTHDVQPYSIWGGVPARLIKMRFDDKVIERLMQSEWWDYAFPQFAGLNILDPIAFCDGLDELKTRGLKKYEPKPLIFDEITKSYEDYEADEQRKIKANTLAQRHWILRRFIKILINKKRYKKLKTDPDRFFNDSKSWLIKVLKNYYINTRS